MEAIQFKCSVRRRQPMKQTKTNTKHSMHAIHVRVVCYSRQIWKSLCIPHRHLHQQPHHHKWIECTNAQYAHNATVFQCNGSHGYSARARTERTHSAKRDRRCAFLALTRSNSIREHSIPNHLC